jgi:3-hydroxyisobutyrate dehydrogenase-like beta-hydroxyacid dehydrogenase
MADEGMQKVAFLGLGKMGAPIAHNLLKAGLDLTVYNRTPAKMVPLVELFSEVFVLVEKSGIDLELMNDLVMAVLAHPAMKEYTARIRSREFEPAFDLRAGFKDVELMLQASSEVQAPLAIASIIRDKFLSALAHGMAERDWSAIYEVTRTNAGLA